MIWRILLIAAILAIVIGGVFWVSAGAQMLTKDKQEVVTITPNTLFGGNDTTTTYVDKFSLGLLPPSDSPSDAPQSYAFILGTSVAAIFLSVFMMRRSRKNKLR